MSHCASHVSTDEASMRRDGGEMTRASIDRPRARSPAERVAWHLFSREPTAVLVAGNQSATRAAA